MLVIPTEFDPQLVSEVDVQSASHHVALPQLPLTHWALAEHGSPVRSVPVVPPSTPPSTVDDLVHADSVPETTVHFVPA
jgi:hypothetical protein